MTDDLRTRIAAAVLLVNHCWSCGPDDEACKRCQSAAIQTADAVIRELASDCATGCMWQIPRHIEDMTDRQREFITRAYEDTLESTAIAAMRAIDEHNARDRSHWTKGQQ